MIKQLEALKTGEKLMVNGREVIALELKNGKRYFHVAGCCNEPRAAKTVITLIAWSEKQNKKFLK